MRHLVPIAILVAFLIVLSKGVCGRSEPEPAPQVPAATPLVAPSGDSSAFVAGDEAATIALFKRASPSVVHVTSVRVVEGNGFFRSRNPMEIPQGTGTGFVWDDAGHVVTNLHVIAAGNTVRIVLADGSTHEAKVVGVAQSHDLAVLETDIAGKVAPLPIGESSKLEVGRKVFAIGNPFGLDQTLTTGVVSGLGRQIESATGRPIFDVVQTDAAINPGNSGGPLLDSAGRVIGVTTAILSPSGASAGIGFAIPVDTVKRIVPAILASGGNYKRPVLGLRLVPDQFTPRFGVDGILVETADDGGPAARAGITGLKQLRDGRIVAGDVIVGLDDARIRTSDDYHRFMERRAIGDKVVVRLERDGKERTVEVVLAAGE